MFLAGDTVSYKPHNLHNVLHTIHYYTSPGSFSGKHFKNSNRFPVDAQVQDHGSLLRPESLGEPATGGENNGRQRKDSQDLESAGLSAPLEGTIFY